MRKHTQSLFDDEMEKVRKQHGCTAAAEEVEFAARRIVRKLLHTPTVRARELASEGRTNEYVAALEALFGLAVDPGGVPAHSARQASPRGGLLRGRARPDGLLPAAGPRGRLLPIPQARRVLRGPPA
ncbi:hypothetical protein [Nesterenkonia pannonica]|uniref:hypothetical protein n=1 Tax=Nesterenkonia pannonica TaxID=1548602 RepID=UPI0021649743|nr:hypothetical protein [Nesterenkonia pannonica]